MQLVQELLDKPDGFVEHVQRYTASVSTAILYGWRTPKTGTGYVTDLLTVWDAARWSNFLTKWTDTQQWMTVTSEAVNFNLVDFYPFLRKPFDILPHWLLPGKRKLYELQKLEDRVFFDLLYRAKAKLAAGNAYPSQFFSRSVAFTFTPNVLLYDTQLTVGSVLHRYHTRHAGGQRR